MLRDLRPSGRAPTQFNNGGGLHSEETLADGPYSFTTLLA